MAKSNEQLEDILDDLSVIKNNNVATEQRLGNIENLLAKLAAKRGGRTNNACCKYLSSLLSL